MNTNSPKVIRTTWMVGLISFVSSFALSPTMGYGQDLTATPPSSSQEFREKRIQGIGFRFPSPLELELVAAPPLVQWPVVAEWDSNGDLIVVESAGIAGNAEEQTKTRPHRLIRLMDENRDGTFDRRIVAAADLGLPEGILCIGNQALVSTPPQILLLKDEDGDGIYEKRDVWFDGQTLTYCANDLHGPYLGRDGWIYWCKGAFAEQTHALVNGKTLVTKGAHIFRRRLEGGPIEPVMTGGMDNPVEVAITPQGERFFTSTFLQHPGGGKRDGIAHAVYGGVYGKDHQVIDGHPRTGPLMPIMTQLGPAAPSGLISLRGSQIASDSRLFSEPGSILAAALFNLQRVTLHRLIENGASYSTEDKDLLVGDRIDFHPTDVLEDADGSLLVVDTGGWYDLCCPSSAVDQELAKGGIYRIKGFRSVRLKDPRGLKNQGSHPTQVELVKRLTDPRWWVRKDAMNTLVAQGNASVAPLRELALQKELPEFTPFEIVWTLCRIEGMESEKQLQEMLADPRGGVRQAAIHALSVRRSMVASSFARLIDGDPSPQVRRAAAEGLGRVGDAESISILLKAFASAHAGTGAPDRVLIHSILYALIEIDQPEAIANVWTSLATDPSNTPSKQVELQQLACIQVLDQLHSKQLKPTMVMKFVASDLPEARATSSEILARHAEWVDALLPDFRNALKSGDSLSPSDRSAWLAIASGWKDRGEIQQAIFDAIRNPKGAISSGLALEFLRALRLKELPASLDQPIAAWIDSNGASQKQEGPLGPWIDWIASLKISAKDHPATVSAIKKAVVQLGDQPEQQYSTVASLPEGSSLDFLPSKDFARKLIDNAFQAENDLQRIAISALARVRLDDQGAQQLLDRIPEAAPLLLPTLLAAIQRVENDGLDRALMERLTKLPAARTLPENSLVQLYRNRSDALKELAKRTTQQLQQPPAEVKEKLLELEASLPQGDAARGFQVFRTPKAACSACHQIGYVGGSIGPELSKIGSTRTRYDLLEAILYPSLRLAQSYQPQRIAMQDGQTWNGLVKRETAQEVELVIAADRTIRLDKSEIESRSPSNVSIMPAGLDQTISPQDLADLIAMLESKK